MSAWELPTSLTVNGAEYDIRSDFRAVLDILSAFGDPKLPEEMKLLVMVRILYPGWEGIPLEDMQEAAEKAVAFIDAGIEGDSRQPRMMDWEQDANILVPAVNKVAGMEIRGLKYLHWWTFLGYYMEIGDSTFSQVLNIRQKKRKGRKLDKWEREFYGENKKLIDLKKKDTRPEEEKETLKELFGLK